jgi:RimJ/RimL family protein N-acetyltransferase
MVGHWRLQGFGRYVMTLKSTGQPIGHVGALQIDTAKPPELTWTIWEDAYEGKGYTFEAVYAYIAHIPKVHSFVEMLIRIENKNQRSLRLADRIGATQDETAVAPHWMPTATTLRLRVTKNG